MVERNCHLRWQFYKAKFPKEEIIYFCQVLMVYIVMIISIVNLCISDTDTWLWSSLVSGSVWCLLPSPWIRSKKENGVISYDSAIEQQHADVSRYYLKSICHNLIEPDWVRRRLGRWIIISTHLVQYSRRWMYAKHYNTGQKDLCVSSKRLLFRWI